MSRFVCGQASSAPPAVKAAIAGRNEAPAERAGPSRAAHGVQAAPVTAAAAPVFRQSTSDPLVRPPSPFATGSYAPPPPPAAIVVAGGQAFSEAGNRSAVALAAEIVAANSLLAERARAKRAYAAADKAQVSACQHNHAQLFTSRIAGTTRLARACGPSVTAAVARENPVVAP